MGLSCVAKGNEEITCKARKYTMQVEGNLTQPYDFGKSQSQHEFNRLERIDIHRIDRCWSQGPRNAQLLTFLFPSKSVESIKLEIAGGPVTLPGKSPRCMIVPCGPVPQPHAKAEPPSAPSSFPSWRRRIPCYTWNEARRRLKRGHWAWDVGLEGLPLLEIHDFVRVSTEGFSSPPTQIRPSSIFLGQND